MLTPILGKPPPIAAPASGLPTISPTLLPNSSPACGSPVASSKPVQAHARPLDPIVLLASRIKIGAQRLVHLLTPLGQRLRHHTRIRERVIQILNLPVPERHYV